MGNHATLHRHNMNRPDVIRQPLGVIIATFAAIMAVIIVRVSATPYPIEEAITAGMPLGRFIDRLFPDPVSSCITGIVFAFLSATMLTGIIVRYSVSSIRTYLPMIIYTLTAYGIYFPVGSVSATVIPLLLTMSCGRMIASFKRSYQFGNVFRAGFYLGIIPMIYAPGMLLIAILPAALVIYRRTLRESAVALAGLLLPWLYCSVIWWGAGEPWNYISGQLIDGVTFAGTAPSFLKTLVTADIWKKSFLALYSGIALYSVTVILRRLRSMRTRARKIYIHFLWLFLLCIGLLFIPGGNITSLALLAVPGCVIVTAFFIRYRGWLPLGLYLLLIAAVVCINISPAALG